MSKIEFALSGLGRRKKMPICETKNVGLPKIVQNDLTIPLNCNPVTEDFYAYKKAIADTIETNINLLRELPPPKNIPIEKVITFFRSEIKCDLQKDDAFEKSVEIRKYAKTMFESMEKYFKNIFDFHAVLKNEQSSMLFDVSKLFLNSDLPETFLRAIHTSSLVEIDYIDLFDRRIRKERLYLVANRNNRSKFERICDSHNKWVYGFSEKLNTIQRERIKLIWYVDINNSNDVEEIFQDKIIKTKQLEHAVLSQLIKNLEKMTFELEALIIANMESPCLPTINVDESVKAITAMMEILNH